METWWGIFRKSLEFRYEARDGYSDVSSTRVTSSRFLCPRTLLPYWNADRNERRMKSHREILCEVQTYMWRVYVTRSNPSVLFCHPLFMERKIRLRAGMVRLGAHFSARRYFIYYQSLGKRGKYCLYHMLVHIEKKVSVITKIR